MNKKEDLDINDDENDPRKQAVVCNECNINKYYLNCGIDCVYHIPKRHTKDKKYCKCTNPNMAKVIITYNYCPFKKISIYKCKEKMKE